MTDISNNKLKIETLCVTGKPDYENCDNTGSITTPIYLSATFSHSELGKSTGYDYGRLKNPTRDYLENLVSSLDNARFCSAYTTGMAAITALFDTFEPGTHIIASDDLYGGTERLFNTICKKLGLSVTYVNTSNLDEIQKAILPTTKILYFETPGNPMMKITDIKAAANLAHKNKLLCIVDNTFLTPYLQQPLALGADVVVQSGTKFLCGHNDCLAGFVTTNNEKIAEALTTITKTTGSGISPFDSYLVIRGIKTLAIRLDRQCENAKKVAQALKKNKFVKKVLYPGLEECPGYKINKRQAKNAGSMISFYVDSEETVKRILKSVKIIHFAESLGGVDTLITYPATQTHSEVPETERNKKGITNTLLRLSIGIENAKDIIADLEQAIGEK